MTQARCQVMVQKTSFIFHAMNADKLTLLYEKSEERFMRVFTLKKVTFLSVLLFDFSYNDIA